MGLNYELVLQEKLFLLTRGSGYGTLRPSGFGCTYQANHPCPWYNYNTHTHARTHAHTHTHTHRHTHIDTHTHTHTHTGTRTRTHTHNAYTHTQQHTHHTYYRIAWRGKTLANLANPEIRQSFTHSNLHLKIVEIRLIDYREKFTESKTSVQLRIYIAS